MPAARALAVRLLACGAAAAVVAATTFLCAWHNHRDHYGWWTGQSYVCHNLTALRTAVERHQERTGHLPERLEELRWPPAEPGQPDRPVEPEEVVDLWKNPYVYRVEGDGYTLYSLGRDGKPGGAGPDADLYGRGLQDTRVTLRQFAFELPTAGMWLTSGLAGGCVFVLGFRHGLGRPGSRQPLLAVGLTAVASVGVAMVISVIHIPTGH